MTSRPRRAFGQAALELCDGDVQCGGYVSEGVLILRSNVQHSHCSICQSNCKLFTGDGFQGIALSEEVTHHRLDLCHVALGHRAEGL